MKTKAFSAVRWTGLSLAGKSAIAFVQLAVFSRMLSPSDFGLIALAVSIIAIMQVISDGGLSSSIVRSDELNNEDLSNLFWFGIVLSISAYAIIIAISYLVGVMFSSDKITPLIQIIGLVVIINTPTSQIRSQAEKNIKFRAVALIEIISSLIGMVLGVWHAITIGGVYSLALAIVSASLVQLVAMWFFISKKWRPAFVLNPRKIANHIKFGLYSAGFGLINSVQNSVDVLILGKSTGTEALGYYSLPKDLCLKLSTVINPAITRVGFPLLSMYKNDKTHLATLYSKTVRMTSSLNFPLYIFMSIYATEIIYTILGNQWEQSVHIFRLLCIWGLIRSIGNPAGGLVLAVGRSDIAFYWSLALLLFSISTLSVAAQYNTHVFVLTMIITAAITMLAQWYFVIRPLIPLGLKKYLFDLWPAAVAALTSALLSKFIASVIETIELALIAGGLCFTLLYLIVSKYVNKEWFTSILELFMLRKN